MARKVIVTGGAGFIGSNVVIDLVKKGYDVTVLDNLSEQVHGDYMQSQLYLSIIDKVTFIRGDVRNEADWSRALQNQEIVVHLAAETGTGQSMYEVSRYVDVNIKGTAHLLHYLANQSHTIKKVVVASSRAVYGEGKYFCTEHGSVYPGERRESDLLAGRFDCTCPICNGTVECKATDELSKLHPTSVYGITKLNQEQMVLTVCKSLRISAVAYRYQNVYGEGQSLSNPYTGILSIFSTQIKNNNQIKIFEDGLESRDFIYIDDVVNATVLGITNDDVVSDVFDIGTGQAIDVMTVANNLIKNFGHAKKPVVTGNFRLGDIRHNYADLTKVKQVLGFVPKVDFDKGVEKFVSWVDSQNIEVDRYDDSIDEMKSKGLFK